ncbi:hypothetical protein [uncultured Maribacter sp.]|uniref:hypothetical protein n=1 Tax=uncultured Maribacter sp. TaxID=431308 RepID=UPI002607C32C|nr:hypothetical protein [uncultured Maribacter sp.]
MKEILNQFFEIEQKITNQQITTLGRNIKRLHHEFEREGFILKNPIGEKFSELRTDMDATIMGELNNKLIVTKVLKPIIYQKQNEELILIQKAVVIVGN